MENGVINTGAMGRNLRTINHVAYVGGGGMDGCYDATRDTSIG